MNQSIESLTALAYQYGPFFFAVVYSLFIPWRVHKMWGETKEPKQRETYRLYFMLVMAFGFVLVSGAVIWWMKSPPLLSKFEGRIENLAAGEQISSGELYFRRHPSGESGLRRDEYFMIVNDKPFPKGKHFTVYYSKDGKDQEDPLVISYDPDHESLFRVIYDSASDTHQLKPISPVAPTHASMRIPSLFGTSAYAADDVQPSAPIVSAAAPASPTTELATTLQNGSSLIGQKITALDRLGKLSDAQIQEVLRGGEREPMIATLADLARHSDKELAAKAGRLLYNRIDLKSLIAERLKNPEGAADGGVQILYRLDQNKTVAILDALTATEGVHAELAGVTADIMAGKNILPLVPTGSKQGDRYYVKAEWDPANRQTVERLSVLFNSATEQQRTMEAEARLMQGKRERWIYSYDKDWAFDFARKIRECGAKASFVDGSKL